MATILRAYSFEAGSVDLVPSVDRGPNFQGTASTEKAKTGSYSFKLDGAYNFTTWIRFPIPGSPSDPSVSLWLNIENIYGASGTDGVYISFTLTPSGKMIDLRWNGVTKTFDAYIDGSLVASGSEIVSVSGWVHVQFYLVISSSGSINAKLDGHPCISYSGNTDPAGGDTGADYIRFEGVGHGLTCYIDDLVIGNGGYLGDLRCVDLRPNADTAVDDWTPSSGTDNYAMIDETPPSDSDYNEALTDGDADELELTDFDGSVYSPAAVTAWVRAVQTSVGDQIKVGVDSGGTDDVSAAQNLSAEWEYYFYTLDNDPNTATEWTDAALDALKLRYEAVI